MLDGNIIGALISLGAVVLINQLTIDGVSNAISYIKNKIRRKKNNLKLTKKHILST